MDGNVEAVYAHEGQRVVAGDVLGTLNDWQWRTDLAAIEAKYQQAEQVMENDLARGSARPEQIALRPSISAQRLRELVPNLRARSCARLLREL